MVRNMSNGVQVKICSNTKTDKTVRCGTHWIFLKRTISRKNNSIWNAKSAFLVYFYIVM